MSDIKTGGPAFPTDSENQVGPSIWHHAGMTLRDYFVAKAMQSLILGIKDADDEKLLGVISYVYADKMIEARKNGPA